MNMDEVVNCPIEFFNSLAITGIPQNILSLKIDAPIIRLRNINPPRISNGTRLAVKKIDALIHRSDNSERQIKRRCSHSTHSYNIHRHAIWIQTIAVSRSTCFFDDYHQSTRSIASSVWIKSWKSMLCICTVICCMFASGKSHKIIHFCPRRKNKKILCMPKHFNN